MSFMAPVLPDPIIYIIGMSHRQAVHFLQILRPLYSWTRWATLVDVFLIFSALYIQLFVAAYLAMHIAQDPVNLLVCGSFSIITTLGNTTGNRDKHVRGTPHSSAGPLCRVLLIENMHLSCLFTDAEATAIKRRLDEGDVGLIQDLDSFAAREVSTTRLAELSRQLAATGAESKSTRAHALARSQHPVSSMQESGDCREGFEVEVPRRPPDLGDQNFVLSLQSEPSFDDTDDVDSRVFKLTISAEPSLENVALPDEPPPPPIEPRRDIVRRISESRARRAIPLHQ
jgi:hypothetical protein